MSQSFVTSITSSLNYRNAPHLDVNDEEEGIITWTMHGSGEVRDWFFVLPNVTIDGKKAVIIKIKDGLSLKINAKIIMHCTSWNTKDDLCNLYGIYFGC